MRHLDLIRNNFIAKAAYFARLAPGMSVEETHNYIRVDSGLPSDTYNAAVIKTVDSKEIPSILQYYQHKNFPTAFWVWESADSYKIEQQLNDLQLVSNEINIGMLADLQLIEPVGFDLYDFVIQLAITPKEVQAYAEVLASLFEPSDEAVQVRKFHQIILPFYLLQSSPIQFFIGMHQGRAVSTGTIFFEQDTVGIYDIATREDARGRGFGSQMFHYLLKEAKRQGAKTAVLQASPDGLSIYKKAGFEEVGVVKVFENRHLLK